MPCSALTATGCLGLCGSPRRAFSGAYDSIFCLLRSGLDLDHERGRWAKEGSTIQSKAIKLLRNEIIATLSTSSNGVSFVELKLAERAER